jgi:hypothetical protein
MDAPARRAVTEEGKELARLCRTGRLYDVEKWIAAGKPLNIPVDKNKTLLRIAAETGFHSLIELIDNHETNLGLGHFCRAQVGNSSLVPRTIRDLRTVRSRYDLSTC